jgi:eukaryotic-like serine/threonine-protein kinase
MHPELIGGRYRVGPAVGRGGMGTVWLCRDEMLLRDVAVKQVGLLPGESVTDSARALREARSSAALSHRNVVTVFDVVEEQDAIWLVMEYVPSRSLADLVSQEGALDPAHVADIGAQVADGLAAAHAAGTMHRDVKPGNVLVREDGVAKISDFGIARSAGDPALTQSGLVTGTPSYFAPELARGDAPTPASDVWALGATLYAAVEGRPPYRARENPIAVLHEIVSRQPPAPSRAGWLEPALLRMLDRDPASRWSMEDAAHALHRLADAHRRQPTLQQTRAFSRDGSWPAGATAGVPAAREAPGPVLSPPPPARTGPGSEGWTEGAGEVGGFQDTPGAGPAGTGGSGAARSGLGRSARSEGAGSGGSGEAARPTSPGARRAGSAVLAVLALVLVAAGVLFALTRGGPDPQRSSGDRATASSSPRTRSSGTPSATRSPSTSTGASASTRPSASTGASATTGQSPSGGPSATTGPGTRSGSLAAKVAFLHDYFKVAGTDAGWAQLGSHEQSVGRASYDRFWGAIDSARVSDVTASGGSGGSGAGDTVEATVRYHYADGRVVVERQRLDLVRLNGRYLIDNDDVLSSHTVSQ